MSARIHPIDGVREDFTAFLKDFIATRSLRFRVFAQVWRDRKFSFLTCGRQTISKANDFFRCLFHQLVQFIQPPHELEAQVCAFYMLYGFFFKQPVQNHVRIRVTSKEWSVILQLVANMRREAHWDLVYIFHVLCASKAFHFCATLQPLYPFVPSYAFTPRDSLPLCDGKPMSTVIGLDRMQMLSDIHQRYQAFKRNLPAQREAASAGKVGEGGLTADLDLVRPGFLSDLTDKVKTSDKELKEAFRDFRKLFSSRRKEGEGDDTETEDDSSDDDEDELEDEEEEVLQVPEEEEEEEEEEDDVEEDVDEVQEEVETEDGEYWRNRLSRMAVSRQAARASSDLSSLPIGERRQALKRKRFGGERSPVKSPKELPLSEPAGPASDLSRQNSTVPSVLDSVTTPEPPPKKKSRQKTTPKSPRKSKNSPKPPQSAGKGRKTNRRVKTTATSKKAAQSNGTSANPRKSSRSSTKTKKAVNGTSDSVGPTPPPGPSPKRRRINTTSQLSTRLPTYLELPPADNPPPSPVPGPSGISKHQRKRK